MATDSIQNLNQNNYVNSQAGKMAREDVAAVENQNQKAAEAGLDEQATNRARQAFKLDISREGAGLAQASGNVEETTESRENLEAEQTNVENRQRETQLPQAVQQQSSQIVNIVA